MKFQKKMIYIALVAISLVAFVVGYMNLPKFGRFPQGKRLERVEQSSNYSNGMFHNQQLTPQLTSDKNRMKVMLEFMLDKRERNRPQSPLPVIKTDLMELDMHNDLFVWFGHSSYFIQSGAWRILVDPVFDDASPVSFFNKPFEGTDIYNASDMPEIDYLIITHDHWDHLDYHTVRALCLQVKYVVCPLGVGEYFEHWGYAPDQIIEMDWNENHQSDSGFSVHCLPSRHFSGRTFRSNQTLWASYMLVTPSQTIYLSGDSGYGIHYRQIAERFPNIDLAIMENGQYNEDWKYIHLMPEDLKKAIEELNPKKVMAGHNGKYALSKHQWDEPLNHAATIPSAVLPRIGEVVYLDDSSLPKILWWGNIK